MKIFDSSTLKAGTIAKPFFIGASIFPAVFCTTFFNGNALLHQLIFLVTSVGIIIYLFFLSFLFTKSVIADLSFGNYWLTFSGKFTRYLNRFLYCITFGLYFPRDYTGIVKFFAGHIWIEPGSVPELEQKIPVMIENIPEKQYNRQVTGL